MVLSVVITAYNVTDYISEAVSSVAGINGVEVIIVDDGSTDDTLEKIKKLTLLYEDIKYYSISNSGPSLARNFGFSKTTGDYIVFLDGDDFFSGDSIARIRDEVSSGEVDILFYDAETFYDGAASEYIFHPEYKRHSKLYNIMKGGEFFKLSVANKCFIAQPCLFSFKRSLFQDNSFYPNIIHEDNLFTARLILKARDAYVRCLQECLYARRVRKNSIMTNNINSSNTIGYLVSSYELSQFSKGTIPPDLNRYVSILLTDWLNKVYSNRNHLNKKQLNSLNAVMLSQGFNLMQRSKIQNGYLYRGIRFLYKKVQAFH